MTATLSPVQAADLDKPYRLHPSAGYRHWRSTARRLLQASNGAESPDARRSLRVALLSTFTTELLTELLPVAASRHDLKLDIRPAPFGQLEQSLLDPASNVLRERPDYVVLTGTWQDLALDRQDDHGAVVDAAVRRWTDLWRAATEAGIRVVQLGFVPPAADPLGAIAWTTAGSVSTGVLAVNERLAAAAGSHVVFVDVARQAALVGLSSWEDPRYWYSMRQPCSPEALPYLAALVAGAVAADSGATRRCVVVDLDNTLWGGVVGDDGPDGITLGDGPRGEAFVAFQRYLKGLRARGVILAVSSKNNIDTVRDVLSRHPHMVLRPEDFAVIVADWRPKSEQLREISQRLRLGPQSLVFVDDNPAERAQVADSLPQIEVVELPNEPSGYATALDATPGLFPARVLAADATRARSYEALAAAEELAAKTPDIGDFLTSLKMVATVRPIGAASLPRAAQLLMKTNQFNLTGHRRTQAELETLLGEKGWAGWTLELSDVFTDHGIVGVALARHASDLVIIDTLLLSCRVIGRTAESALVSAVARWALGVGATRLHGQYMPSSRNGLTADVYPQLGFTPEASRKTPEQFVYDLTTGTPAVSPYFRTR